MGTIYAEFDSTPATLVADLKTRILTSSDWAQIGAADIVGATTTRGASMRVDLADAAASTSLATLGVYRTHNGTTGTDKLQRYLLYKRNGGVTSEPLHCTVSAGKEHLYLAVEGPRAGESSADSGSWGSYRNCLAMCDIVPYFPVADTVPAVALISSDSGIGSVKTTIEVSRDQGNTGSWAKARLATLTFPCAANTNSAWYAGQPTAKGDGNTYLWPYVVIEDIDGLRGRLSSFFYAGYNRTINSGDPAGSPPGQILVYSGLNYLLVTPYKTDSQQGVHSGFGGSQANSASDSVVVAVPIP